MNLPNIDDSTLDSANPQPYGGFDAMLSTSGPMRATDWVDQQNGLSINPKTVLTQASGRWYHRSFLIGSKAGEVLSNFKIVHEGDGNGRYVILLDNVKITNGGQVRKLIYEDGFPKAGVQAEGPTTDIVAWTTNRSNTYYMAGSQRVSLRRLGYEGNNIMTFFFSDHLGSTSVVVKADGVPVTPGGLRLYKAWGGTRYEPDGELAAKYRYTGQYEDGYINLYWFGSRWFDPALSRWVQPDQIVPEVVQGTQAWDRFAYVNNSPINFTDPTGHYGEEVHGDLTYIVVYNTALPIAEDFRYSDHRAKAAANRLANEVAQYDIAVDDFSQYPEKSPIWRPSSSESTEHWKTTSEAEEMLADSITDPTSFGFAMHAYQDSFSHWQKTGKPPSASDIYDKHLDNQVATHGGSKVAESIDKFAPDPRQPSNPNGAIDHAMLVGMTQGFAQEQIVAMVIYYFFR